MAYAGAMRNGSTPRLVGMVSKVDEKTLCTESALNRLAPCPRIIAISIEWDRSRVHRVYAA